MSPGDTATVWNCTSRMLTPFRYHRVAPRPNMSRKNNGNLGPLVGKNMLTILHSSLQVIYAQAQRRIEVGRASQCSVRKAGGIDCSFLPTHHAFPAQGCVHHPEAKQGRRQQLT